MVDLQTPISEEAIRALHTGDVVKLSGIVVTARDAAHKLMIDNFIRTDAIQMPDLYEKLQPLLVAFPADQMEAFPVSKTVNSPKNDSPELIEPVAAS